MFTNDAPLKVARATTQLGSEERGFTIPEGSLIIPNRQPDAPLVAAILEFEAEVRKSVLVEDGSAPPRRLLAHVRHHSVEPQHDVWLPAVTVSEHLNQGLRPGRAQHRVLT